MGKSIDLEILELRREERNISMAQMMIQERESVEKIERYTGYALEKLKDALCSSSFSIKVTLCTLG